MITYKNIESRGAECSLDFCNRCGAYPCELVEEYIQFGENHPKSCIPEIGENSETILEATAFSLEQWEKDNNTSFEGHVALAKCVAWSEDDIRKFTPNSLSYDKEELKNGCIMGRHNIIQVECGRKKVAEGIGEHYKIGVEYDYRYGSSYKIKTGIDNKWEPLQPVFISAQTGQGKNYFIEHILIPYVDEVNCENRTDLKILILSNRLALKRQIKNRLKESDNSNEEENIYRYKGVADIMTYQSLLKQKKRLKKRQKSGMSKYVYVVCDEAHFFTSDAMYNPHTQKILSTIVEVFKDAIRIYMSATPYECFEHITECEEKLNGQYSPMVFYHFKRDYSYLDIYAYSDITQLYDEIVTSINEKKEKWLIFIDDKEKCKEVKKELEEHGQKLEKSMINQTENSKIEKIFVVDATDKENQEYVSMIEKEELNKDTYVLISTSVLDNGINLTGIHNIVVSDMSKVKCLQMVGRARVGGADERKKLYILRFNEEYVKKKVDGLKEQKEAYHSYDLAFVPPNNTHSPNDSYQYLFFNKYYDGNYKDWENAKHFFGRAMEEPFKIYLNDIARSMLDRLILTYQAIYDEMKEESMHGEKIAAGQKYLEYQFSWFGKKYSVENDITLADKKKSEKEFKIFLEKFAIDKTKICKEEKESFKIKFTQLYDQAFRRADKNKGRYYDICKMNTLLEKRIISYKVNSKSGYWEVIKFDWISQNAELE